MKQNLAVNLPIGRYVVAVSGGVDSVVLLKLLAAKPDLELVVAHFDHGIRQNSANDAEFVRGLAKNYGFKFETAAGKLGPKASEAAARKARYAFLDSAVKKHKALAVVLAHHQDDVLETILINLRRGSGWRGVAALRDETSRRRPLLNFSKHQLKKFALEQGLRWIEDETNQDKRFLRNKIRHEVLPALSQTQRRKLLNLRDRQIELKGMIEAELSNLKPQNGTLEIDRHRLIMWPKAVALEYLQTAAQQLCGERLLSLQAELLLRFARSAKPNKVSRPKPGLEFVANRDKIIAKADPKLVS